MKKVITFVFFSSLLLYAQSFYQYRILNPTGGVTVTGNTGFRRTSGLAASYASLTWTKTGTFAACTVQVDYSTDGTTVTGQLIAAQTCTSSGTITAGSTSTPAYVRVSYVIGSGGGTLTFADYGCNNSSCSTGSGGTVTSITAGTGLTLTPNPIVGSGTAALTVPVLVVNGGTGTTTPALIAGTNITITGTWPNNTINSTAGGTVTSVGLAGTANQITVTGSTPITGSGSWTLSIPSALILGTDNTTAGTLQLANSAANAHNIFSSGATTTNTIQGFATVPTTGHLVDCTVSSTTCLLHDSGVTSANVVNASSPGAGVAHFAGSTQTVTSSAIVAADITSATITHTQTDSTFPTLVASGTSAMATSAISSATCATVVTTAATGTATTDVIVATPNADPTGVTGYAVASGGSLYIQGYPTTNNVNFKVCNPTSGSLTPSALTLNWKVLR